MSVWSQVWNQVLKVVAESAKCDLFERRRGGTWRDREDVWQSDAKKVRKRVDRYLSKYVSKGTEGMRCYYPPRWYGISAALRQAEKDHLSRNAFVYDLKPPPGLSAAAVAEVISAEMKKMCVGSVGSRRPWNDVNRIWLYGYLREDITREESVDALLVAARIFGVEDRERGGEKVSKVTYKEEIRRLRGILRKEAPYWFRSELYSLLPERSRESFLLDSVPTRDAVVDVEFALKYMMSVAFPRGHGFAPWAVAVMKAVSRALEFKW